MFWDSSAIVPYLIEEQQSPHIVPLFVGDDAVIIWWGTPVECVSALERRRREGLPPALCSKAHQRLTELMTIVDPVPAIESVRISATNLLRRFDLRAGDALQLAAAKCVADFDMGFQTAFVCLDDRLRNAALGEGFKLLPES